MSSSPKAIAIAIDIVSITFIFIFNNIFLLMIITISLSLSGWKSNPSRQLCEQQQFQLEGVEDQGREVKTITISVQ